LFAAGDQGSDDGNGISVRIVQPKKCRWPPNCRPRSVPIYCSRPTNRYLFDDTWSIAVPAKHDLEKRLVGSESRFSHFSDSADALLSRFTAFCVRQNFLGSSHKVQDFEQMKITKAIIAATTPNQSGAKTTGESQPEKKGLR